MTDVSGEPPVDVSSARPSDVLVSVRSALIVVSSLALTVLMLEIALHSKRVIAWVLVAGALAVLLYPAVEFGSRWMARSIVVLLFVIAALSSIGFVGYRIVNDVSQATDSLQQAARRAAAELEKNSDLLRQVHLRRRVQNLVDDLPNRLAGGSGTAVIESAALAVSPSSRAPSSRSSSRSTDRGSSGPVWTRSAIPSADDAWSGFSSTAPGAGSTTRASSCSKPSWAACSPT